MPTETQALQEMHGPQVRHRLASSMASGRVKPLSNSLEVHPLFRRNPEDLGLRLVMPPAGDILRLEEAFSALPQAQLAQIALNGFGRHQTVLHGIHHEADPPHVPADEHPLLVLALKVSGSMAS